MKPKRIWILVADGARGRLLLHAGPKSGLTPATGVEEYQGDRRPSREIGSDRPGRGFESANPTRHGYAPRVDWHEFAKREFAARMAAILDRCRERKRFDELVLVAPPKTLGDLRQALDPKTAACIRQEVAKDLVQLSDHELEERLADVLGP